jgi:riboflavin synthase
MFTGIVQDVGTLRSVEPRVAGEAAADWRVTVAAPGLDLTHCRVGDSIAVAGVCLTVVALEPGAFSADVSQETLRVTTAAQWRAGQRVNLEAALRAGDALGGHLVSGHVDGIATLIALEAAGQSRVLRIETPAALARYIARKGSVALDGVSLTVNQIEGSHFDVNLIPHTLAVTTLGMLRVGNSLNIEVDVMARYVERLSESFTGGRSSG